jgi:hypothetical protein
MSNPKVIKVRPSKNGNELIKGQIYEAKLIPSYEDSLYQITLPNGHEKVISLDSVQKKSKSAHLWDGSHWAEAGYFELIE